MKNRLIAIAAFLLFYSQIVYAVSTTTIACDTSLISPELLEIVDELPKVAGALGALMLGILGVKWVMSENPQEREDAKKGVTYVIIGLLLVSMATVLVDWLYCEHIPI